MKNYNFQHFGVHPTPLSRRLKLTKIDWIFIFNFNFSHLDKGVECTLKRWQF